MQGHPASSTSGCRHRLLLLLPAVTVTVLGLWGLGRQGSLWQDEAVTYDMAHRSPEVLWATLGGADAVHGLYYFFMHAVFACWEGGVIALRLPSVLAMALAAWGVGLLGRWLAGPVAGAMTGLIFALWPTVQRYTQEGRSYALVTAAVIWATVCLVKALVSSGRRWWVAYALLSATACLLHEFTMLALVAHGVTLAWMKAPRSTVRGWAIVCGCILVIMAPLVWVSLGQVEQVAWIEVSLAGDLTGYLLLAGVGLLGHMLVRRRAGIGPRPQATHRVTADRAAVPLVVLTPGLLLLVSLVKPLYVDRYVLYSLAGVCVLAGAACTNIWQEVRQRPARAGLAAVTGLATVTLLVPVGLHLRSASSRSDDATAVTTVVRDLGAPGDPVIFLPQSRRVWMLDTPPASLGMTDLALAQSPAASHTLFGTELAGDLVARRMSASERVVVVRDRDREAYEPSDQDRSKRAVLASEFTPCHGRTVGSARVTVYARAGFC
ncbi:glycosyltransferase family 39 protein [Streptomyces sp. NPDC059409]|uniref:glycosyltransferase family 39 protein n=1 Tax=Streptomyces sp. NPDC059409 TaxID=3346824 RepID=UPI0036B4A9CE